MPHVNTIQSAHSCVLGAMSAECELDLELARTAIGRIADVATRRNAQKKPFVYSTAQWVGHEAKRLHSKLKKIDATNGPAIRLAGTPTSRPMPG